MDKILIVGGYGEVGRLAGSRLAAALPGYVVLAGRSLLKARAAAAHIGHGCEARAIDVDIHPSPRDLEGTRLVLMCVDQSDPAFVRMCLEQGIDYVDVTASYPFFRQVEQLAAIAQRGGSRALLSVGVAPGLSNLLAAHACQQLDRVDSVDIVIELGLGDRHGHAAIEWIIANLDADFDLATELGTRRVRNLREARYLALPGEPPRPAYRFNFCDQHVIHHTLDVAHAGSWLRLSSRLATLLLVGVARLRVGRLLAIPTLRRAVTGLIRQIRIGSDRCAVGVLARGLQDGQLREVEVGVVGRQEARMTSIIAADVVRLLLNSDYPAGVHHTEQVLELETVVAALSQEFPDLRVSLAS